MSIQMEAATKGGRAYWLADKPGFCIPLGHRRRGEGCGDILFTSPFLFGGGNMVVEDRKDYASPVSDRINPIMDSEAISKESRSSSCRYGGFL